MNEETTGNQQKLPLVVGVDLGGTQIRTAAMRGAKLFSRVSLLTGENPTPERTIDRKSTRLNSSHTVISYAVFCLKKKKQKETCSTRTTHIVNDHLTSELYYTHRSTL